MNAHVLVETVGGMAFIVLLLHMTVLVRRRLAEGKTGNRALVLSFALWAAFAGAHMLYLQLYVHGGAAALWVGANLSLALGGSSHLRDLGGMPKWVVLWALAAGAVCNASGWLLTAMVPRGNTEELLVLDVTLLVSSVMLVAGLVLIVLRSKARSEAGTDEST